MIHRLSTLGTVPVRTIELRTIELRAADSREAAPPGDPALAHPWQSCGALSLSSTSVCRRRRY